jgi:hypothetical protein
VARAGGGAQLFWRPPAPGGARGEPEPRFALGIPVAAGEYELVLAHTVAPDFGRFRVRVAGDAVAEVDGYHTGVEHREVSLGRRRLAAGTLEIGIEVIGKHDASTGYIVGLDRLVLRQVAAEADAGAATGARRESRLRPATAQAPAPAPEATSRCRPSIPAWRARTCTCACARATPRARRSAGPRTRSSSSSARPASWPSPGPARTARACA